MDAPLILARLPFPWITPHSVGNESLPKGFTLERY